MIKSKIFIFLIGAGLTACSSFSPKTWKSEIISINENETTEKQIEAQIKPYRDSLSESMNEVIGFAEANLVKGRPCSDLNNWAADALLKSQDSIANDFRPNIALLNLGGLRSSINAGNITVGDIFTLMPFDNLVVWVKMPKISLVEIANYLLESGGEPIGNATLIQNELIIKEDDENKDYFWIVTSDYLMNGGDNMTFFEHKLEVRYTNILLRDALLDQVKWQGTLEVDKKCRINVE